MDDFSRRGNRTDLDERQRVGLLGHARMRPANQDVNPAGRARINYVRDLPDGRRFVNDSQGLLYVLNPDNQPTVYANRRSVDLAFRVRYKSA
jgi:hypothetical protein